MAIPAVPRTALVKQTHHGLTAGMNRVNAIHELPEGMSWTLYDAILDNPGVIRQRGPVAALGSNTVMAAYRALLAFTCASPGAGSDNLYALMAAGAGGAYHLFYYSGTGAPTDLGVFDTGGNWTTATNVYVSQAVGRGGVLIAWSNGPNGKVGLFRGATKPAYSTGTLTATRGSTAVVGVGTSWTANVSPGMFLVDSTGTKLIGVVASVGSNTTLTLEDKALNTIAGAAYQLLPMRALCPRLAKGRITCATGSATVTGALTKFTYMPLLDAASTTNSWDLYRASDLTWIGTVTGSPTNDRQLTLAAPAAIALSNERYIIIPNGSNSIYPLTSSNLWDRATIGAYLNGPTIPGGYASRQFYANGGGTAPSQAQVWFSETFDGEAIDFSPTDGDWFRALAQGTKAQPITAIWGTQNALLLFKADELWALTGDDASNFALTKIADSGTWTANSIQSWRGTTIFAAREGILQFDGVRLKNLTAELGDFWRSNNGTNRKIGGSFVYRNHYVLWVEGMTGGATVRKGAASTTEVSPTIVVNLETGAISLFSNCQFRGSTHIPAGAITWLQTFIGDVAFLVDQGSATGALLCDAASLWTSGTALDTANCGASLGQGPNFYVETRAYDMGDPERTKFWKDAAFSYFANGSSITADSVAGIGTTTTGTTLTDVLAASGTMTRARVRIFTHGATHVRLRLYPTSNGVLQNVNIGTFSLRGRAQRFGRLA